MSSHSTRTITCPKCQQPGPFVMHQSVNVTLDPESKAKLLSGELTRFTCASCRHRASVNHTLLYHDMAQGLMIYLVPGDDVTRDKFLEQLGPIPFLDPAKTRTRLVIEPDSLKDKIFIFDAGLDDRLIEVTKLVLKVQHEQLRETRLYFDRIEGDKLIFASVSDRGVQTLGISRDGTYAWAADKLRDAGVLDQPLQAWPFIGERWAMWAFDQIKS
jgi:hypothetical protein